VQADDADLFEACVEAVSTGATIGEITRAMRINDSPSAPITPVHLTRAAVSLEHLREAMDNYSSRTNALPQVFLCNMGPLREHNARADFSRGFFAVGGYETISPAGFKTPEEAAEAFGKTNCRLVVLCSTDDHYPTLVPLLVKALRQKRPDAIIILAGYPEDQVEAHKAAGVDYFIHVRADAVELLTKFHSTLGIK